MTAAAPGGGFAGLPALADLPAPVLALAARIQAGGESAYLVGGSLRDLCRGQAPKDWDLATSASPSTMRALFADVAPVIPTGEAHGTVTVIWYGTPFEVTTLREDGPYTDRRRPDQVTFTGEIARDLARRDFTVNAMALDLARGAFIDPEGGLRDLRDRVLRAVGDADARFREDPLRLLRGARFAAQLEFELAPATLAALGRHRRELATIAPERIQKEWMALLAARRPSRGFRLCSSQGLLAEIAPELSEGLGVVQNRYHRYDVLTHGFFACDEAPASNPRVRLAALLHDVGKPRARQVIEGEGTFYGHDKVGAEMADTLLQRLRFPNADREWVIRLIRHHLFQYREDWTDAAVRRFIRRVGEELVPDLFLLRTADARASGRLQSEPWGLQALQSRVDALRADRVAGMPAALALDGHDVMHILGLAPGREVGAWLDRLWEAVLDDPALNTREELTRLLSARPPAGLSPTGSDSDHQGDKCAEMA
ncbi:MAG TPA: CCA tRNA nucleotidyltransferase [Candidatus Udaeobacter sp.]|nr:CCA tRNA nucleotidyltransferase [Candidatus Udaeobacter sp.]